MVMESAGLGGVAQILAPTMLLLHCIGAIISLAKTT